VQAGKIPSLQCEGWGFFLNPSPRLREAFASAGKPGLPSGGQHKIFSTHLMGGGFYETFDFYLFFSLSCFVSALPLCAGKGSHS
jgi:hypothetical protein